MRTFAKRDIIGYRGYGDPVYFEEYSDSVYVKYPIQCRLESDEELESGYGIDEELESGSGIGEHNSDKDDYKFFDDFDNFNPLEDGMANTCDCNRYYYNDCILVTCYEFTLLNISQFYPLLQELRYYFTVKKHDLNNLRLFHHLEILRLCNERSRLTPCKDVDIADVTNLILPNTRQLTIKSVYIATLGENFCRNMILLEKLAIYNSKLNTILPSTFEQCKRLRYINLPLNDLTTLADVRFISSMMSLVLAQNNMTMLPHDFCKHMPGLQFLNVARNDLKAIPPNTFACCGKITEIYLKSNDLVHIKDVQFPRTMQYLVFPNNEVETLGDYFCDNARGLKHLYLSRNLVKAITSSTFDR